MVKQYSKQRNQRVPCHHALLNCCHPCAGPCAGILDTSRHRTLAKLRHDQSCLPSSSSFSLHDASEAHLPNLLPKPKCTHSPGRCDVPALRFNVASETKAGGHQLDNRGCDCGAKHNGVWAEDTRVDDCKSASRHVLGNPQKVMLLFC